MEAKKIDSFGKFHNFTFEEEGLHVQRAYGIAPGKLIFYNDLITSSEDETGLIVQEDGDFFPMKELGRMNTSVSEYPGTAAIPATNSELFQCPEPGCQRMFKRFRDLEIHIEIGSHGNKPVRESMYNKMRREWAKQFSSVDAVTTACASNSTGPRGSEQATDLPRT